jgi:hypothetical protein
MYCRSIEEEKQFDQRGGKGRKEQAGGQAGTESISAVIDDPADVRGEYVQRQASTTKDLIQEEVCFSRRAIIGLKDQSRVSGIFSARPGGMAQTQRRRSHVRRDGL